MENKHIKPATTLQSYIRYFQLVENDCLFNETKTFKIIADGSPGLIFQENTDCFSDKKMNKLPQLFLHGLASSHSQKRCIGKYSNIVVSLQPNAIKSVFGIDASELVDTYIDLKDIVKNNITEQLLNESKIERKIEILGSFFFQQSAKNKHPENPKSSRAIARINTKSDDSLLKIQSALNLSERSLERIFKTDIGISPKLFFRICRFQAALDRIRNRTFTSLTDIAHQHSYSDQSHFIRDFNEFTGVTPKRFLSQANEQILNFPEWTS